MTRTPNPDIERLAERLVAPLRKAVDELIAAYAERSARRLAMAAELQALTEKLRAARAALPIDRRVQ